MSVVFVWIQISELGKKIIWPFYRLMAGGTCIFLLLANLTPRNPDVVRNFVTFARGSIL